MVWYDVTAIPAVPKFYKLTVFTIDSIPSFKTHTAVGRSPTGTVTSIKAWRAGTVVFIYQEKIISSLLTEGCMYRLSTCTFTDYQNAHLD